MTRAFPRLPLVRVSGLVVALTAGTCALPQLAAATGPPSFLFSSPSGNIICGAPPRSSLVVNCQERGTARYFDVNLYVGGSVRRGNGGGDPGESYVRTIPYGHSVSWTAARCTSLKTGMRCVLTRTGHGFLINLAGIHRV
jgi:hypothetical protein